MREWLANFIVLGLSAVFLWLFILIAIQETVTIQEPNPIILGLEIAIFVGFIAFAVVNMVGLLRGSIRAPTSQ